MHLHHPQVTAEPSSAQPFSLLPAHLLFGGEWVEAPALVQVPWGLIPAGPLHAWDTQEQATLWGASQGMPAWFASWLQHN